MGGGGGGSSQPCIVLLFFLFLADQIFYRSYVNRQHFRLRSFASCPVFFGGPLVFSDPICGSFLTWFGHDFPAGQFVSVRSCLIAAAT